MKKSLCLLNNLLLIILLCVFSFASAVAGSDNFKQKKMMRGFSVHDTNGDGLLSRDEYQLFYEYHKKRRHDKKRPRSLHDFEEVDTNHDGFIDEDELISKLNRHLKQHRRYRYRGEPLEDIE